MGMARAGSTTALVAYPSKCDSSRVSASCKKKEQNADRQCELYTFQGLLLLMTGGVLAQQAPHVCGIGPGPNEVMAAPCNRPVLALGPPRCATGSLARSKVGLLRESAERTVGVRLRRIAASMRDCCRRHP